MADFVRTRLGPHARWWRVLGAAYWLGWQIESNWTDPFLFAVYMIAQPLGAALIVVLMYVAVAGSSGGPMLDYVVVGTAFWPLVFRGMAGVVWGVVSDREQWRTIRYVYIAPLLYPVYLVGRALAQISAGGVAVLVVLLVGRFGLAVPLGIANGDLDFLVVAMLAGIASITALGLASASIALLTSVDAWRIPETASAALYLLCGAIFPVTGLPTFLQHVAYAFPLTWWLEALRRSILVTFSPSSIPWATDGQVLWWLISLTAAWSAASILIVTVSEHQARRRGVLDQETAF